MYILYDSTFDGLLSAAAYCFRRGERSAVLLSELDPRPILESLEVPAEPNIRLLFSRHLTRMIGSAAAEEIMDLIFRAFLSDTEHIATQICQFLALALDTRANPAGRLCETEVAAVVNAARRTSGQAHQFLGLLRFRSIGPDFFAADFAPECHVLPLILPHFCDRLPDQNFAIRDLRRHLAALHLADGRTGIHILADEREARPEDNALSAGPSANSEDGFAPLWQLYLKRLSIPGRYNPALQKANMPKKYWKYLVEQP